MRKVPRRILIGLGILLLVIGLVGLIAWELVSSALEARFLARTAQKMTWQIKPGPSERIRFPGQGPYDVRLGYSKLPDYLERLQKSGWQIDAQAKVSVPMEAPGARVPPARTFTGPRILPVPPIAPPEFTVTVVVSGSVPAPLTRSVPALTMVTPV